MLQSDPLPAAFRVNDRGLEMVQDFVNAIPAFVKRRRSGRGRPPHAFFRRDLFAPLCIAKMIYQLAHGKDLFDGVQNYLAAAPCRAGAAARRLDIFSDEDAIVMADSEVLVAADLLYDEATAEALGRRAAQHMQVGGRVIIADPGRPGGRAAFVRGLRFSSGNAAAPMRAARAEFVEQPLPRRWRGTRSEASVGICVLG